ncbi:hypothetical protein E2562_012779 [Oryza meyeriana var. granulata]|uniref:Uncharacterized protein n=1 Tax=Oryza meyeriana var. granulata TaxID=110450 RepID=A0A6G1DHA7_9ORYZ|nr:hypothetical protein E2562_012779 [Oryza meyeriana var. granulata]
MTAARKDDGNLVEASGGRAGRPDLRISLGLGPTGVPTSTAVVEVAATRCSDGRMTAFWVRLDLGLRVRIWPRADRTAATAAAGSGAAISDECSLRCSARCRQIGTTRSKGENSVRQTLRSHGSWFLHARNT